MTIEPVFKCDLNTQRCVASDEASYFQSNLGTMTGCLLVLQVFISLLPEQTKNQQAHDRCQLKLLNSMEIYPF